MSDLMQFFGGGSSPIVVTDLPIETGETLAIGDYVGIDQNEKLIKIVPALNTSYIVGASSVITSMNYGVDGVVIFNASPSLTQVRFYDGVTNTLSAATTLTSTATVGKLFDVVQLNNGNIVICYGDGTSIYFATFTSAGASVSNSTAKIAYTAVQTPTINFPVLVKGYTAGEFFVFYNTVTSNTVTINRYDSSYAQQSSIATTTTNTYWTAVGGEVNGWEVIRGTSNLCLFTGTGTSSNFGYYKIINGTTGAAVGSEGFIDATAGTGFRSQNYYDSVNTRFILGGILYTAGTLSYVQITESTGAVYAGPTTGVVALTGSTIAPYHITPTTCFFGGVTSDLPVSTVGATGYTFYIPGASTKLLAAATLLTQQYAYMGNGLGRLGIKQPLLGQSEATGAYTLGNSPGTFSSVGIDTAVNAEYLPTLTYNGFKVPAGNVLSYGGTTAIRVTFRQANVLITKSVPAVIIGKCVRAGTTADVDVSQMPITLSPYLGAAYSYRSPRMFGCCGKLVVMGV